MSRQEETVEGSARVHHVGTVFFRPRQNRIVLSGRPHREYDEKIRATGRPGTTRALKLGPFTNRLLSLYVYRENPSMFAVRVYERRIC